MNNDDKILSCVVALSFLLLSLIVGVVVNGWVLSILWGWFAVPIFELPNLSVVQAMGVAMIVGFLTANRDVEERNGKSWLIIVAEAIQRMIIYPLTSLVMGYIISGFL